MAITAGTKLGPYEILALLGAGGMGEVYRARDTRLDRTVAIKVLASSLAQGVEFRARFEREARSISALQHPNICTLHDVGSQDGVEFLVMEYLEGETLASRLQRGPLPFDQVKRIGSEVARALGKAHRQGIVHRDLKPGNIMLTKAGAKLMDFGLAKAQAVAGTAAPPAFTASMSLPTAASPVTVAGTVIGTVQYMAPEQVQGQEADARSDIFSLGAVLYEMATGKRAFEGKSQLSVASAILEKEPEPIRAVQPLTPAALEKLVMRCLRKDPDERWQSAADLAVGLEEIGGAEGVVQPAQAPWSKLVPWLVAAVAVLGLVGAWLHSRQNQRSTANVLQASIPPPEGTTYLLSWDESGPPVLSRDGRFMAFVAVDKAGAQKLWVRTMASGELKSLAGTDDATYPFWSPDGKSLGFFARGRLRRVPAGGGPVVSICDVARARGGAGAEGDTILFTPDVQTGIFRVAASSDAAPQAITKVDTALHTSHRWPVSLPDGKRFLYLAANHAQPDASATNGIYVASFDGKENRFLLPADANVVLVPGYLLFLRDSSLFAQRFDAEAARLQGEPTLIAEHLYRSPATWRGIFDSSDEGVLVFPAGGGQDLRRLLWYGADGKSLGELSVPDYFFEMRLSPDGTRLAVTKGAPAAALHVYDLKTATAQRLEFEASGDSTPVWSPDGKFIAFAKRGPGKNITDIYRKPASGARESELLYSSTKNKLVNDWTPDGQALLFQERAENNRVAIWLLPLTGERKPRLIVTGNYDAFDGHISPDGRWIAYTSNGTIGTDLFVSSYPDMAGKWQVSAKGGEAPHWQRDGKALYYLAAGRTLMKVDFVAAGGAFEIKAQHAVANVAVAPLPFKRSFAYDVMPDGKRILVNGRTEDPESLTVISNWMAALNK